MTNISNSYDVLTNAYLFLQIVLDCTKLQREGKLDGTPLRSALKGRLFGLVGLEVYTRCEKYLDRYTKNYGYTRRSYEYE